jgi:hypothetical protein
MQTITGKGSDKRPREVSQSVNEQAQLTAQTPVEFYRLNLPMMVLAFRDNHQAAVTIQVGETVEVVGPAEDDRFVVVDIKGEQFLVFASDLKDRGELIPDGSPSAKAAKRTRAANRTTVSKPRRSQYARSSS